MWPALLRSAQPMHSALTRTHGLLLVLGLAEDLHLPSWGCSHGYSSMVLVLLCNNTAWREQPIGNHRMCFRMEGILLSRQFFDFLELRFVGMQP